MPEERIALNFEVRFLTQSKDSMDSLYGWFCAELEDSGEIAVCLSNAFQGETTNTIESKGYSHDGFNFVDDFPLIFPPDPEFEETSVRLNIDFFVDVKSEDYDSIADFLCSDDFGDRLSSRIRENLSDFFVGRKICNLFSEIEVEWLGFGG